MPWADKRAERVRPGGAADDDELDDGLDGLMGFGREDDDGSEEGGADWDAGGAADGDEFLAQVQSTKAARKLARKEKYAVEPRIAAEATLAPLDQDVKRAATYQIIKNRGLTAHKSKINRNPRVKKREQYRKATIRRKGQVRDMRDSAEGDRYAGEATGIRAGLSRSRKIGN